MGRMVLNEFSRLWKSRNLVLVLILACFIVSMGMRIISGKQGLEAIPEDYKNAYKELIGLSVQEAYDIYKIKNPDIDDISLNARLIRQIKNELESQLSYEDNLDGIIERAEQITSVSIFADKDSFAYKNALTTAEKYKNISGKFHIELGPSKGIMIWSETPVCWIIILLVMAVVVNELTVKDKESGQLTLLFTLANGRKKHGVAKLAVLLLSSFMVTFVIMLTGLASLGCIYGLGDISRTVQSVYGMGNCILEVSVLGYICLQIIFVAVTIFLISVLIMLIMSLNLSAGSMYLVVVSVIGLEMGLFYGISENSYLACFKEFNFISFLNTGRYLSTYGNVNMAGIPIYRLVFVIVSGLIIAVGLIPITVMLYSKQSVIKAERKRVCGRNIRLSIKCRPRHVSVIKHEAFKLFYCGGSILIVCGFIAFRLVSYNPVAEQFEDENSIYYKEYALELEGPVTEEKLNWIESERGRYDKIQEEMRQAVMDSPQELVNIIVESYNNKLKGRGGLEQLAVRTAGLREKGDYILYDNGYKLLTLDKKAIKDELLLAIMCEIMLVLSVTFLFAGDYQIKMDSITDVCLKGRSKLFIRKITIGLLVALAIWAVTYMPYLFGVLNAYGYMGMDFPAGSVSNLSGKFFSRMGMTVKAVIILLYALKYLVAAAELFIIAYISKRTRSVSKSIVIGLCLFTGPLLIGYLI